MLPYRKIFKQAYEISKNNKFLWIFGLFLSLGSLLNFFWSYAGAETISQRSDSSALAFVLIVLFVIVLYFRTKAGLVVAVKAALDRQETNFWRAFRTGRVFFNRILIISIFTELGLVLLGAVLGSPVGYLFSQHFTFRAVILLVLAILIFIPAAVAAILVNVLSPMFVVIFDLKIQEAVSSSFELIFKYWNKLAFFGLVMFLAQMLPLFLAEIVIKLQRGLNLGLISTVVFLVCESAVAAFTQTAWVLAFLELIKPQKLEEEESATTVPEVIS